MAAEAPDQDGFGYARAALRRMTDAYLAGRLSQADFRRQRRRLLDAVTGGRPVPDEILSGPGAATRRARRIAMSVAGVLLAGAVLWGLISVLR